MLIKLKENQYLNSDYILTLFINHQIDSTSWYIAAKMIDNQDQILLEFEDEATTTGRLRELVKQINIHQTRIIKTL